MTYVADYASGGHRLYYVNLLVTAADELQVPVKILIPEDVRRSRQFDTHMASVAAEDVTVGSSRRPRMTGLAPPLTGPLLRWCIHVSQIAARGVACSRQAMCRCLRRGTRSRMHSMSTSSCLPVSTRGPSRSTEHSALAALVAAGQAIRVPGYLDNRDFDSMMQAADVLLLTFDGYPGPSSVLVKAARAGKPVVGMGNGYVNGQITARSRRVVIDTLDALPRALRDVAAHPAHAAGAQGGDSSRDMATSLLGAGG